MLDELLLYLKGYLILELYDGQRERFINLCKNKEIEIIHIFEINNTWFCRMQIKDYKKIREFAGKTKCCPKICRKCGLPLLITKIKQRKGCIIGILLFLCILEQCTGRIWSIKVQGGYLHTREQILQVLAEEMDIYGGVPADTVDCFQIEKRLRLDYSEIGWISVEKKGCCLFVMMNESVMPDVPAKETGYRHITAERDGIVRAIEVTAGVPLVKAGDIVSKGDILISGIVPIVSDYDAVIRNQPVNAEGKVILETELEYQSSFSMRYEQKKILQEKQGIGFFLFDQKIFSYIPRYSDGKYDIISSDIVPYSFENYMAPAVIRKYRCLRYETELVIMTDSEAEQKACIAWEAFLEDLSKQKIQVIKADMSNTIRHGQCRTSGNVIVCGNFISYQEILEEEWKLEDEYSGDNP